MAIEEIRAQGRRAIVLRGWAEWDLIDDQDDCFAVGEVGPGNLLLRWHPAVSERHHGSGSPLTIPRRRQTTTPMPRPSGL
ncbi:hypothetical protein ACF08N_27910 [Streptomyces sp. NPDC015127]|uniref:hypothetical protein n=1 Tax=Streptomyces sp. NPDC015127 TaxID=3364939 RepID=UPI0037008E0C